MHEWALAEAIISAVLQIAEREGMREVREVKVKVGELQSIDLDVLKFAISQLKTAKLKIAKFDVRTERASFKCRVCGCVWAFDEGALDDVSLEAVHFIPEVAHAYVKCPNCGSPDFEISGGRGVWLESVEGVK